MNFKSKVTYFAILFISMLKCYYCYRMFALLSYNWDYSFHIFRLVIDFLHFYMIFNCYFQIAQLYDIIRTYESFMMINIQTTYILSDNIYFEAIKTVIRMLVCKYTQILSINRQMCFYPFDFHLLLR